MENVLDQNPRNSQQRPDTLSLAKSKIKKQFSGETARLIEDITRDVDDIVTDAITIDPILRGLSNKNKSSK